MLMGELATVVKYRLPVKIIILKNNLLGMIKWEQIAFEGNPQYGVDLQPIDFALLPEPVERQAIPSAIQRWSAQYSVKRLPIRVQP